MRVVYVILCWFSKFYLLWRWASFVDPKLFRYICVFNIVSNFYNFVCKFFISTYTLSSSCAQEKLFSPPSGKMIVPFDCKMSITKTENAAASCRRYRKVNVYRRLQWYSCFLDWFLLLWFVANTTVIFALEG